MCDDDHYYLNEDDFIHDAIANAQNNDYDDAEQEYYEEFGDTTTSSNNGTPPPPHPEKESSHLTEGDGKEGRGGNNNSNSICSGAATAEAVAMTVPQRITTIMPSHHTNDQNNDKHYHHYHEEELYKFERYTGLSSWRSSTSGTTSGANAGAPSSSKNEHHGATTMEATSWKKKKENEEKTLPRKNDRYDDDDDESMECNTDNRTTNARSKELGGGGGGGGAGRGVGSQAQQLIRFREKDELILLGRSWGRERQFHPPPLSCSSTNDRKNKYLSYLPQLGEESMAMTLADGTRTFVKKTSTSAGMANRNEEPLPQQPYPQSQGEEGRKKNDEQCLLSLSMTELIRRADILQKRAIQRKIEREGGSTTTSATTKARNGSGGGGISHENVVDDDGNVMEDGRTRSSDDECASTENDAILRPNDLSDDKTKEKEDDKERKVTFQLQTQSLQRKRQHHKLLQQQQRLWVDKHAPTSISHLLSDERTNREVLRALRAWDPYVFKREAPARPTPAYLSKYEQPDSKNYGRRGAYGKQGKNDRPLKRDTKDIGDDNNFDGTFNNQRTDVRPDESSRVILLSGPPGVGKSTLAHIVCKHAGYHAIEVNASDERTASSLTERVTRAMESTTLDLGNFIGNDTDTELDEAKKRKSGGGKGGKPNCIILDEIDGADAKTSIAALVDIIRADIPSATAASKGKKSKGAGTYLRRPIILICNHKYAPALRPILPYARQFDVQPPNSERLTSRLRAVLAAERMSVVAGGMLLRRLVAGTGGDIRSCLYALQFASARAREVATKKRGRDGGAENESITVDISSALMATLGDNGNGMKDMQSDVSSTVATVFRKDKVPHLSAAVNQNKRQKTSNGSLSSKLDGSRGVDIVLKAVEHFGDNSKTLDCLFMNINRVSYVDPTLDRCYSAFEWLSEADMYRSHNSNVAMNNSAEHHSMQKFYIPTAAAAVHLLCCVETRPDLTFSTRPLSDSHYQNQANISLVHRFIEGLAPMVRRGCGGGIDTVVSDVIPYGLWLLSAGDGKHSLSRQVSSLDLLSAEEKLAFSAHVETLRALGLTYVKDERTFDHKSPYNSGENLRLEPEIDKLVKFEYMDEHIGRIDIRSESVV